MVFIHSPIEGDFGNSGGDGTLGEGFAHQSRGALIAAVAGIAGDFLIETVGGHEGAAGQVIDHLRVNVLVAAEHGQARTRGTAADLIAHAIDSTLALFLEAFFVIHRTNPLLGRFWPV